MNRIAQRPLDAQALAQLQQDHALLHDKLRGAVPPSVLGMFPKPQAADDGQVQWLSYLSGEPIEYNQLPPAKAQALLARLEQRLETLAQAIEQLHAKQALTDEQAQRLKQLTTGIAANALVSVADEPLILYWGKITPAGASPTLLPLGAAAGAAAATAATAATAVAASQPRKRWWLWLLGLLLLLLLAALLWWLFSPNSPRQAPSLLQDPDDRLTLADVTVSVPDPTPIDPLQLWQPVRIPGAPPKACPEVQPCPEPTPEPEPQPEPEPEPEPPPPPPPPKPAAAAPPPAPKPVTVATAQQFCPGQRPAELAPEMVIVFDNSGSMNLNIGVTYEQERNLMQTGVGGLLGQLLAGTPGGPIDQFTREPKRITVAKQAVADVVRRLPSDVRAGLVTVGACPASQSRGFFGPGERSALMSQIQRLEPDRGTPLADGVARAGSMLDGVSRQAMMLVVTDGLESCGGDPCAQARRLAASKPHLTINVVDIGNSGSGNCLAQATGGQVFTAQSVSALKLGLERATKGMLGPDNCP